VEPAKQRLLEETGLMPLWQRRVMPELASAPSSGSPASWEALAARVAGCRACTLCETRKQTVFGVGPRHPEWLFVGEAPGADEDARGEPFVGHAGRLLDNMLGALGLSRDATAFIANVLKCRPPGNREPTPQELASCSPFLFAQIAMLRPRVIVALGRFAAQTLLQNDASVGQNRTRVHRIPIGGESYPVIVTYHPSYLLRTPQDKRRAWADLCLARDTFMESEPRL